MNLTNKANISLSLAVWLLHDEYDYINKPNYISATTLLKPIKHILLPSLVPQENRETDLTDLISTSVGRSLHDSIEKAWLDEKLRPRALKLLGYSDDVIKRIVINPTDEQLSKLTDAIPIYLEQRAFREINGWTIGGKYDMIADGVLHDTKTTSAYTWVYGGRDEEHALQGSLYRLLNPKKVTEDYIRIEYIFTDWQKSQAKQNPNYPQQRLQSKDIPLWELPKIEQWVKDKLTLIEKYKGIPEKNLPECTKEELWMSDPVYKYFADPTKTTGRSTKNFDDALSAQKHLVDKGGKGIVIPIISEPKRCGYCDAFSICTQKDKYFTKV